MFRLSVNGNTKQECCGVILSMTEKEEVRPGIGSYFSLSCLTLELLPTLSELQFPCLSTDVISQASGAVGEK
jgi:hypothetical protein